jgi:hypothetical protein
MTWGWRGASGPLGAVGKAAPCWALGGPCDSVWGPMLSWAHCCQAGHCSALVKLLPDYSDVFFAHDTWASVEGMLR